MVNVTLTGSIATALISISLYLLPLPVPAPLAEVICTWSGQLPPKRHKNPTYSPRVFLGGVPWDITEASLIAGFRPFGNLSVDWPGKEGKHNRHPPKGEKGPVCGGGVGGVEWGKTHIACRCRSLEPSCENMGYWMLVY